MWGAPGRLFAALVMGEWTGEPRWDEAARESAAALRARRGDDGLWRQDDDYRGLGTLHGAAGNTLVLIRVKPDEALVAETAAVLSRTAFREGGLANWPGTPRAQLADGQGRAPSPVVYRRAGCPCGRLGVSRREVAARRSRVDLARGPHGDEKGHDIFHGTSGNGFALRLDIDARYPIFDIV